MPRERTRSRHPVWSLLKCLLLLNLLAGFVACAYDIQIGMGIVAGTVVLMGAALCLRIMGVCPDRTIYWVNTPPPTRPATGAPRPIQKQEYVLVSNPDMSIYIGTRALPSR